MGKYGDCGQAADDDLTRMGALVESLNQTVAMLDADNESLRNERLDLLARITALEAVIRPPVLFGANAINKDSGIAAVDAKYGRQPVLRLFWAGLPQPVPAAVDGRPVHVSFKAKPVDVLAGRHDVALQAWFAGLPAEQDVYWTFFHEPEDNIAAGEFTAQQYRDAWRRIHTIAAAANKPYLHATTVLMAWTVDPKSGRQWLDYWPGDDTVDVMGWDWDGIKPANGAYPTFQAAKDTVPRLAAEHGKPWVVAEFGAPQDPADSTGEKRAAWMLDFADYFRSVGTVTGNRGSSRPSFVCLFDSAAYPGSPLVTTAEIDAWKQISSET